MCLWSTGTCRHSHPFVDIVVDDIFTKIAFFRNFFVQNGWCYSFTVEKHHSIHYDPIQVYKYVYIDLANVVKKDFLQLLLKEYIWHLTL